MNSSCTASLQPIVEWYCGNHIPGYFLFLILTLMLSLCFTYALKNWETLMSDIPHCTRYHLEQRLFQMAFLALTSCGFCWCIETITRVAFLTIPPLTHPVFLWNQEISICLSDDPRMILQATQQRASAQSFQTGYLRSFYKNALEMNITGVHLETLT